MGNGDLVRSGYAVQAGYLLAGDWKRGGLEFVARYDSIDMDDRDGAAGPGGLIGQTVDTFALGLNYRPISEIRLSMSGFLFDIDRPLTDAGDRDPFKNGAAPGPSCPGSI